MRALFIAIVRLRNPNFTLDAAVSSYVLVEFAVHHGISLLRGLRMVLWFRRPKGIMLGSGVHFLNLPGVTYGKFLRLGKHVHVSALGREGVQFGNHVSIGAFSRVVVSTSLNQIGNYIRIGNNVGIGEYAYLGGGGGLEIGDDCIVGQYLSCHPENHNYLDNTTPIRLQGVSRKGIKVGANCWIGSKVTLLDGVEIGSGSIIAAGSVVTQSFPENAVIGGVPAKLLKFRTHES